MVFLGEIEVSITQTMPHWIWIGMETRIGPPPGRLSYLGQLRYTLQDRGHCWTKKELKFKTNKRCKVIVSLEKLTGVI